jgi:hypothetical protein
MSQALCPALAPALQAVFLWLFVKNSDSFSAERLIYRRVKNKNPYISNGYKHSMHKKYFVKNPDSFCGRAPRYRDIKIVMLRKYNGLQNICGLV